MHTTLAGCRSLHTYEDTSEPRWTTEPSDVRTQADDPDPKKVYL